MHSSMRTLCVSSKIYIIMQAFIYICMHSCCMYTRMHSSMRALYVSTKTCIITRISMYICMHSCCMYTCMHPSMRALCVSIQTALQRKQLCIYVCTHVVCIYAALQYEGSICINTDMYYNASIYVCMYALILYVYMLHSSMRALYVSKTTCIVRQLQNITKLVQIQDTCVQSHTHLQIISVLIHRELSYYSAYMCTYNMSAYIYTQIFAYNIYLYCVQLRTLVHMCIINLVQI